MKVYIIFFSLLLFTNLVSCHKNEEKSKYAGALYVQTQNPEANKVHVLNILKDGRLTYSSTLETGGKGIIPPNGAIENVDSVVVGDNFLFVSNTRSSSISTFRINPKNPSQIALLNVVATNVTGAFVGAVAYSSKLKVACALNALPNGVVCFAAKRKGLKQIPEASLTLPIVAKNPRFAAFFADIRFNEDSTLLFLSAPEGRLVTIPVNAEKISYKKRKFTLGTPKIAMPVRAVNPYSVEFVRGKENTFIYSDLFSGYGIARFDSEGNFLENSHYSFEKSINDFCWSEYSEGTGNYYFTSPQDKLLIETSAGNNSLSLVTTYRTRSFGFDIRFVTVDGNHLGYIFEPTNHLIEIIEVRTGLIKFLDVFDFTFVDPLNPNIVLRSATGLAIKLTEN